MKKTYIQPRIEQFLLAPTCMLARIGGQHVVARQTAKTTMK